MLGASVPKCKKAVIGLMGKMCVDKLHSGMSFVGHELNVNDSIIHIQ